MAKKDNDKSEVRVTEVDSDTIKNALANLQGLTEAYNIIADSGLSQSNVVYDILFKSYANAIMGENTLDYQIIGENSISPENIEVLKRMGIYDSEVVEPANKENGVDAVTHYYIDWSTDRSDKETEHED